MFIQTESTPNPATLKFLPGQAVLGQGAADFPDLTSSAKSPLAGAIFAVPGVTGVFLGSDFITVTKAEGTEWAHVKPAILGAVLEHFQSGRPAIEGEAETAHATQDGPDSEIVEQNAEFRNSSLKRSNQRFRDAVVVCWINYKRKKVFLIIRFRKRKM